MGRGLFEGGLGAYLRVFIGTRGEGVNHQSIRIGNAYGGVRKYCAREYYGGEGWPP